MTMIRFGRGQLVEELAPGMTCLHCGEGFDEIGGLVTPPLGLGAGPPQAQHVECLLRMIVGGVNHQRGLCTCCGGTEEPDPPNLTKREAARLAAKHYRLDHRPQETRR